MVRFAAQKRARRANDIRHRINAGRVAVRAQISFFKNHFGQLSSDWKADASRVTFADFAISERVLVALREDFPKDQFCSEEAGPKDDCFALTSEFAWVIDPVDGTNNYALGFPCCTIALALLMDGKPIYGFIYDFSTDSLIEGGGRFGVEIDQRKVDLSAPMDACEQALIGLHFPMDREVSFRLAPLFCKYRVRALGSISLTLALVATGYLYGAIDTKGKLWDIAAAVPLLEGAGMDIKYLTGSPFPVEEFAVDGPAIPLVCGAAAFCQEVGKLLASEA